MAVLFDTNVLMLVLQPAAPAPIDPVTGERLTHVEERVNYLIRRLSKIKTDVLIPTPVLAEILCGAGSARTQYLQHLQKEPFRVVPFDVRAAIDCADLLALPVPSKRKGTPGLRAKIKFDRQIVAIAKTHAVEALYSDDEDVFKEARRLGLRVVRSFDLERDPELMQGKLDLEDPEAGSW